MNESKIQEIKFYDFHTTHPLSPRNLSNESLKIESLSDECKSVCTMEFCDFPLVERTLGVDAVFFVLDLTFFLVFFVVLTISNSKKLTDYIEEKCRLNVCVF